MTETDLSRTEEAGGAQERTAGAAGALREQASGIASAGTQEVQHVAATAKEEASAVVGDVRTQARRVVSEATSQLRRQGDEQANRLAGTLGDLSQELRRMSDAGGDGTAAGIVGEAAGLLDRLGGRLIEGGLDGAMYEVKRFARNRPGVFLTAAVGAGFVAGRLVRNVDPSALTGSHGDTAHSAMRPDALVTGPAPTTGGPIGTSAPTHGATGLGAGPTGAPTETTRPTQDQAWTSEPGIE